MKQQLTMVKKHVMTGISFMIPLVVGAGLCMAISIIIGGPNVSTAEGTFAYTVNRIGSLGMTLVVPVITAAIAYSISDRPGVAPGLIIGLICTEIKAGFIGGIVGAFLVGYFVNWLKKLLRNVPESIKGLVPILLIPLISTFVCGLLMFYVSPRNFFFHKLQRQKGRCDRRFQLMCDISQVLCTIFLCGNCCFSCLIKHRDSFVYFVLQMGIFIFLRLYQCPASTDINLLQILGQIINPLSIFSVGQKDSSPKSTSSHKEK